MLALTAGSLNHKPVIQPEAGIFCGARLEWSCSDHIAAFAQYLE